VARPWLGYFLPGFHPWQVDDRALIALADSPYADARGRDRLPSAA
jgi:predicted metal-dependent hydrolase